MTDKSKWELFFDTHAPRYDQEVFAQNTDAEVAILVEVLSLEKGAAILDIGCGTGRHTVGLAKAGYDMTGVDLSSGMLNQARQRAEKAGMAVQFVKADASQWQSERLYDAVICLCEGAMCLVTEDDDPWERDQRLLGNIASALKPGGLLVINALNGLKIIRQVTADDVRSGQFDPVTMTERSDASTQLDDGTVLQGALERWYTPAEFVRMIRQAGLEELHVWGGEAGNWRKEPPSLDEYEIMVVARRKG